MAEEKFKNELGLIHVYTGDGKGKTSAAIGLAIRAVGHGFKAYIIQFMKGGRYTGELLTAEKYLKNQIKWAQFGQASPQESEIRKGNVKPDRKIFLPFEDEVEKTEEAMAFAEKIITSREYDLVVLDEINVIMDKKLADVKDVLKIMMKKPKNVELVLTGRNAPKEIMFAADYVNEIKSIKHPFDTKKILGRRGIEY